MGAGSRTARALIGATVAAAIAAALALALLLALPPGPDELGAPTVVDAARLASRPAAAPAPPTRSDLPTLPAGGVDGVAFPNWERELGWRATRARVDELGRRRAGTVFYERSRTRLGYTIVSGPPLARPADAIVERRGGVELALIEDRGRAVVSWRCQMHTCLLSGEGVDPETLLALALRTADGTSRSPR